MNNQVLEHVEDLDTVLDEIHCVMTEDGKLLCLFPTKEVLRESHVGVPLAHRFPASSSFGYYYLLLWRSLGFRTHKAGRSRSEWARDRLKWIDSFTYYRTRREVLNSFHRNFHVEMLEDDYIKFRLGTQLHMPWIAELLRIPMARQVARVVFRRLAGIVILARKKDAGLPDLPPRDQG